MRIDKYLSALQLFSRKQSAHLIKKGFFLVNEMSISKPEHNVHDGDTISREENSLVVKTWVTVLIDKPTGYVSSDEDEYGWPSYKKLLDGYPYTPLIHIAGRLDVDTEGVIIATSDGQLNHRIISPKHHLPKTYLVTTRDPIGTRQLDLLRSGVVLDDGYKTKPAQAKILKSNLLELILIEGKYHQVKRMLLAVGNEVLHLQRTAIGPWSLDDLAGERFVEIDRERLPAYLRP